MKTRKRPSIDGNSDELKLCARKGLFSIAVKLKCAAPVLLSLLSSLIEIGAIVVVLIDLFLLVVVIVFVSTVVNVLLAIGDDKVAGTLLGRTAAKYYDI